MHKGEGSGREKLKTAVWWHTYTDSPFPQRKTWRKPSDFLLAHAPAGSDCRSNSSIFALQLLVFEEAEVVNEKPRQPDKPRLNSDFGIAWHHCRPGKCRHLIQGRSHPGTTYPRLWQPFAWGEQSETIT